jgi:hypothetical protein
MEIIGNLGNKIKPLGNNFNPKISHKYCCEACDYVTDKKSNINNHFNSAKHKKIVGNNFKPSLSHNFICDTCNKEYKTNSGLWKHKKICQLTENNDCIDTDNINIDNFQDLTDKQIIAMLIKENSEFKSMMLEQHNMMMEVIKNGTNNTTTNSHNKTFNLNFFLNEQCKNALNMSEFLESIKVEISDLENTGRLGFVQGISKLLVKNLKALDQYQRPIHCSDLKRETLYMKDNDMWDKEDEEKSRLKNAIRYIVNKNIQKIAEWSQMYPDCRDPESRKNDTFLRIVSNSMSGSTVEEIQNNLDSIVRNIAREVTIIK